MQWLLVGILAGRALKERQCTLQGKAHNVNIRGSILGGECTLGCRFLTEWSILIIDRSEMTKSHMFNIKIYQSQVTQWQNSLQG